MRFKCLKPFGKKPGKAKPYRAIQDNRNDTISYTENLVKKPKPRRPIIVQLFADSQGVVVVEARRSPQQRRYGTFLLQ